jgi:UDP-N-acetylglucosamine:LPS N-acetylglucosamine transferase
MPEIRDAALAELELDPARFTVFVNAGWAGGGNIPALFDALLDSDLPIQMVFVAGRNEALRRDAEARAASARFPVRVLGFTEQMERVMAVASVMVSKLGGLTTFEALACGLPVLGDAVTPPMPQEERTARLLERTGAGLMVQQPREVVDAVRGLIANPDNYARVRRAARALGVPDATRRIVAELDGVLARTTERRARSVTGVA